MNLVAPAYTYNAELVRVVDGDTVDLNIDLGLSVWKRGERIRLYGINAPEVRGEEKQRGLAATTFLYQCLANSGEIIVETIRDKKGKYGRYLGNLYAHGENGTIYNVNEHMINEGHAVRAEY